MAAIDYRPDWCPFPEHQCLLSYSGVFALGRLPKPLRHDGLLDTHCFCFSQWDDGENQIMDPAQVAYFNLADMIYLKRCMLAGIADILENKLYRPPGFGTDYGQAEAREAAEKK